MDGGGDNPFNRLLESPPFFDSWYTWLGILAVAILAGIRTYLRGPQYFSQTSLAGKVAIVTGANRGIGFHIASELALRGAKVYIGCRDETLGKEAEKLIRASSGNDLVFSLTLTLGSFTSVREFASAIKKKEDKLDILCHNAGVMVCPLSKTTEGFEYHFGVNYLGAFLLTRELTDLLKADSAPSRIVCMSSAAYALGNVSWDDVNLSKIEYGNGSDAFAQSKLALMLMVNKLSREFAGSEVTVNACHPGVVRTDIHRYMPISTSSFLYVSTFPVIWYLMKNSKDGAQTPIYLCVDENVKTTTGKYFVDMQEKPMSESVNDADADKLWNLTEELIRQADVKE